MLAAHAPLVTYHTQFWSARTTARDPQGAPDHSSPVLRPQSKYIPLPGPVRAGRQVARSGPALWAGCLAPACVPALPAAALVAAGQSQAEARVGHQVPAGLQPRNRRGEPARTQMRWASGTT